MLSGLWYSSDTKQLLAQFKNTSAYAIYQGVTEATYAALVAEEAKLENVAWVGFSASSCPRSRQKTCGDTFYLTIFHSQVMAMSFLKVEWWQEIAQYDDRSKARK